MKYKFLDNSRLLSRFGIILISLSICLYVTFKVTSIHKSIHINGRLLSNVVLYQHGNMYMHSADDSDPILFIITHNTNNVSSFDDLSIPKNYRDANKYVLIYERVDNPDDYSNLVILDKRTMLSRIAGIGVHTKYLFVTNCIISNSPERN